MLSYEEHRLIWEDKVSLVSLYFYIETENIVYGLNNIYHPWLQECINDIPSLDRCDLT